MTTEWKILSQPVIEQPDAEGNITTKVEVQYTFDGEVQPKITISMLNSSGDDYIITSINNRSVSERRKWMGGEIKIDIPSV